MLWFMGSQRVRHDGVTEMNGELYLNGSIQYVSFCGWLLSLSIMFLRFMHVLVCIGSSVLLLMSFIPLSDYIIVCLSILLLIDTWAISSFDYLKENCHEHLCTSVFVAIQLHSS